LQCLFTHEKMTLRGIFYAPAAFGRHISREELSMSQDTGKDMTKDTAMDTAKDTVCDNAGDTVCDTAGDTACERPVANGRAAQAENRKRLWKSKCADLMLNSGVTVMDPDATYIDEGVTVGADSVIYPGCVLEGRTAIGRGCEIGPNTRIRDCTIGDGARIEYSVLTQASVGDSVTVGPFAHLRPGAVVGAKTRIGDYVEIKNSNVGEDVKIAHLAYVGDADVGDNVNIACGVITCNYDGRHKHRTVIGKNAFIGSNVNLVAPVNVSENTYVASGSTITEDVPEDALAIARARQVVKENWVSRKGLRQD